jgi:hypothetical protein
LYARDNSLIFNRRQEFECPPATPLPVSVHYKLVR